jgi:hypothetical protein
MSSFLYQQFSGNTAIFTLALQISASSAHELYIDGVYVGHTQRASAVEKITESSLD